MGNIGHMSYRPSDHTFVVCAYRESPYLEACVRSLLQQKTFSKAVIATSTPNESIRRTADKYGLELYVREGEPGIAADWNFAVSCARTHLVTIAHQDDIYTGEYLQRILEAANRCRQPLILFTDYGELRSREGIPYVAAANRLLRIKRILLMPLLARPLWRSIFVRRRILSIGSAICCPSVTIALDHVKTPLFEEGMKSNIDWQAWEKISHQKGEFAYIPKISMLHRIHEGSTTTGLLEKNGRRAEDLIMYRTFWQEKTAQLIEHFYQAGEKSNEL